MPTPVSIDAWLERGHDDLDLLVHRDRYFVGDDPVAPLALLFDDLLERLPEAERLAVNAVVMAGMSYRDAAVELDMRLTSGAPNGKRVYRLVQQALETLRVALMRRAPWASAFLKNPGLLAFTFGEAIQEELM